MIIANLATYPGRIDTLPYVVDTILPQVDKINIVLNEFKSIPDFLRRLSKVCAIIPEYDTKDTGKFLPDVGEAEWVFLIDDDFLYPKDYVEITLNQVSSIGLQRAIYSHLGVLYQRPAFRLSTRYLKSLFARRRYVFKHRKSYRVGERVDHPVITDELGTGVAVLRPELMPPFDYMKASAKFVDVRLAQWCFENEITPVCLAHSHGWIPSISYGSSIYESFSKHCHGHVAEEIWKYAFKVSGRGKHPSSNHAI